MFVFRVYLRTKAERDAAVKAITAVVTRAINSARAVYDSAVATDNLSNIPPYCAPVASICQHRVVARMQCVSLSVEPPTTTANSAANEYIIDAVNSVLPGQTGEPAVYTHDRPNPQ